MENSRDPRLSEDMAGQVAVYAHTHVLVGLHGAGNDCALYLGKFVYHRFSFFCFGTHVCSCSTLYRIVSFLCVKL